MPPASDMPVIKLIKRLDNLEYFKYTTAAAIPGVKASLYNSIYKPDTPVPLCYPTFDVEFEGEGLLSVDGRHIMIPRFIFYDDDPAFVFTFFIPLFERMGLKLNIGERFTDETYSTLEINGSKYILDAGYIGDADLFEEGIYSFATAVKTTANIIRAELSRQGKEDEIGIRNAGQALCFSVLTRPMFAAIDKLISSPESKPIPYYEWAEWEQREWM